MKNIQQQNVQQMMGQVTYQMVVNANFRHQIINNTENTLREITPNLTEYELKMLMMNIREFSEKGSKQTKEKTLSAPEPFPWL